MTNNDMSQQFSVAAAYAANKHAGQTRADGSPYIYHPLAVARMVKDAGYGMKYQIAAVLHDTLEDTGATEEELRQMFGNEITDAVLLLTRRPGEDEEEYVSSILRNHIAAVVKNADKINNLRDVVTIGQPGTHRAPEARSRARMYVQEAKEYYQNRFSAALNDAIDFVCGQLLLPDVPDRKVAVCAYSIEDMQLFMDQAIDPKLQEELPDFSLPFSKMCFVSKLSSYEDPILFCLYDATTSKTYSKKWKLTHHGWVLEKSTEPIEAMGFENDLYSPNEMIEYLRSLKYECHYFQPGAKLGIEI